MTGVTAFVGDEFTLEGDWASWFPERSTITLALPGGTTDDLLAQRADLVAHRPAAVTMLIGSNDLIRRKSVEHLVRNIQFLMVTLRKELPGSRLLLQSLPPAEPSRADQLRDANRHLRQFSSTINAHYLDLWPALADADGQLKRELTDDHRHLNQLGYEQWLAELRPALERLDGAPPMSRPIPVVRG